MTGAAPQETCCQELVCFLVKASASVIPGKSNHDVQRLDESYLAHGSIAKWLRPPTHV